MVRPLRHVINQLTVRTSLGPICIFTPATLGYTISLRSFVCLINKSVATENGAVLNIQLVLITDDFKTIIIIQTICRRMFVNLPGQHHDVLHDCMLQTFTRD